MSDLDKEIKRLSNLKNYKGKAESELKKIAQDNLSFKQFKSVPLFEYDGTDEKIQKQTEVKQSMAEDKFKVYLKDYEIETPSDLDVLRSLVFNEVFENDIQKEINKLSQKGSTYPEKLTKQLVDIQNQKDKLKEKLGIGVEKTKEDELTGYQKFIKRVKKYIIEHRNEFTWVTDSGKIMLARKKVNFDSIEHPWFAGRWFFNYEILKDVKEGKITAEDAWRYLCGASSGGNYAPPAFSKKYCTDYINYCLENWAAITNHIQKNKEGG